LAVGTDDMEGIAHGWLPFRMTMTDLNWGLASS
jgi:hypothetical protein